MRKTNAYIFLVLAALCLIFAGFFYVKKHDDQTYPLQMWTSQLKPLGTEAHWASDQVILIHFWASWCSPCRTEMPELLASLPQWKEKYQIYLVSEDEQMNLGQQFAQEMSPDPSFLNLFFWDQGKFLAQQLMVNSYPETFFFNSKGLLLRKITGSMNWKDPKNLEFLKSLPSK